MVQFRVIHVTSRDTIDAWCKDTLFDAYKSCIENNPMDWHVRVFTEILREFTISPPQPTMAIQIAYTQPTAVSSNGSPQPFPSPLVVAPNNYVYSAYYIQILHDPAASIYVQFPTNLLKPGPLSC